MTLDLILFFVLAVIAVGAALAMLVSDNAVYSVVFLVLNFAVVSVFYLLLNAPFIAMVQVTVYAGAIMVLFMFVVMLLGAEKLQKSNQAFAWQQPVAVLLGLALLVVAAVGLLSRGDIATMPAHFGPAMAEAFGSPLELGRQLFTTYLFPFEITSVLLLVAMVGAIVLTKEERAKIQKRVKTVK
jgi:NADH-quinone oxidoreductase subunit J